jgi:hypothetical protein
MQEFTGLEYLKIDIANHAGHDKLQYHERLAWVDEFEDDLEDLVDLADKPFQYLAAVMAYRDAQNGKPTGHLVGFDSCASGLQFMAALTGCKATAKNTGLIGDRRMDMYGECTKAMSNILGSKVEVARKAVKSAQMPHFYGSKKKAKQVFGDGTDEFFAFHRANYTVATGACELLELLLASWQPFALSHDWTLPDGFEVHCPVMVNVDTKIEVDELDHASFVYQHKINEGTETGLSNAANVVHSLDAMVVREMGRRCNYDRERLQTVKYTIEYALNEPPECFIANHRLDALAYDSGFYSLVAVDHIDVITVFQFSPEYLKRILELIDTTLTRKTFPVIFIHDDFKAHANNINTVRRTYVEIMAEIANSNMLNFIMSQIRKESVNIDKFSQNLGDQILEADYALS